MAVKTITIDLEAYETLARLKSPGQSFSQVIKERIGREPTGKDLRAAIARLRPSSDALDRIDEIIARRRDDLAKVPEL